MSDTSIPRLQKLYNVTLLSHFAGKKILMNEFKNMSRMEVSDILVDFEKNWVFMPQSITIDIQEVIVDK
jgi:hypothetical protein